MRSTFAFVLSPIAQLSTMRSSPIEERANFIIPTSSERPKSSAHLKQPPQPTRRPPAQMRSFKTRERIMSAARKAFAEEGFEAASIRDIAAEVDVTHTLIRYHFGSKEELWKDVVTDMFQRLDVALSEKEIGPVDFATREGLTVFLRHYIRYCAENPEHARIMISESLHGGERLKWMIKYIRESHLALIPIFKQLMKTGVIPEVWLISLFYAISTVCQMPFVLSNAIKELYGVDMHEDDAINAHTETVIALLLNHPERSPDSWPSLPDWAQG